MPAHRGGDELDGAAGEPEVEDPQRVAAPPVEHHPDRLRGVLGDGPHPGHRQVDAHEWHPSPMGRAAGGAAEPVLAAGVRRDRGARRRGDLCCPRSARSWPGLAGSGWPSSHRAALRAARPGVAGPVPVPDAGARRRARRTAVAGGVRRQHHALPRVDRRRRGPATGSLLGRGIRAHRPRRRAGRPPARRGCSRSSPRPASGRRWLGWERERPGIPWDRLLFSAKEATYKAWYPLTGMVVGHDAVRVELSASGSFTGVAAADDAPGAGVEAPRCAAAGCWARRVLVALGVVS